MAEAVLLAISKIGIILAEETSKALMYVLSEKATNLKELPTNVKRIEMELNMMNGVIQDLGTSDIREKVVKCWIGEVRKVAYHVEDVMDKYLYHAHEVQENGKVKLKKVLQNIKIFSEIADEIVQIVEEIKHVKDLKSWAPSVDLTSSKTTADVGRQTPRGCMPDFIKEEDLVGVEENRRKLTGWLYSNEWQSAVITVSGMGGLGKTTLARNVYDREKVNFPGHAWVVVSQTYDEKDLLRKLLMKIAYREQPPPANMHEMDAYELIEEIKKILQHKKVLIILDDVWDHKACTRMCNAFKNLQESRIVITTRKEDVTSLAHEKCCLQLQPLSKEDSFKLFYQRAFNNKTNYECPPELKDVATSIVQRCEGLPLAIVSMGSLLSSRQQTKHAWSQAYNQLRNEMSEDDHIRAILNLSYHDMPGDLRNCFLYCSMFPEDYPMSKETLVRLWVAEGFVQGKDGSEPEDVAEGNLMELISRNMLEVVESDELSRVSTCKMHDIVRDLALIVAKEEMFGSASGTDTMTHLHTVRRFSTCRWKNDGTQRPRVSFPHLRTLLALEADLSFTNMLNFILSGSNYLTVLELQDSAINEVPTSIGNLFNLRYIGLRRTNVQNLPECIGNLSNLQTLDIKQTKILKLPQGIVKVKKLRHLIADRYADEKQSDFRYFIGVEAPKGLSGLEELQTLETVEASKELAEQLEKLMNLQSLWIDNISATHCAKLFMALSKIPNLSSLLLSACDEKEELCFQNLKPKSTKLHRLIIRGHWATGTLKCPIFKDHGENLRYLALSWCQLGEDPLGVLASHVPNLTYLRLNNMSSAKTLTLSAGSFPKLKTIVLKRMPDVNQLVISDGALPVIEGLYVVSLQGLDRVPQGIETLRSLKKLWLLNLHKYFKVNWTDREMHQKMQHVPDLRGFGQIVEHLRCTVVHTSRAELQNDNIQAILNMSYYDMPGDLRNCFLYCIMFPEDYPHVKGEPCAIMGCRRLRSEKNGNKPEDVAEGNIMELIHRNMLVVDESDELGRVSTCKIYDIVRDLALSVAKEEKFGSANDNGTMEQMYIEVRRFSTRGWKGNITSTVSFPHL
uniref:Disease resistance protein RPM1 n=1 Tax=Leersia perrieri TaxID=77586 RepID=A0A0D9XQI4_9ORYZ